VSDVLLASNLEIALAPVSPIELVLKHSSLSDVFLMSESANAIAPASPIALFLKDSFFERCVCK